MKRNLYLVLCISAIAALLMFSVIGIYRIMSGGNYYHDKLQNCESYSASDDAASVNYNSNQPNKIRRL